MSPERRRVGPGVDPEDRGMAPRRSGGRGLPMQSHIFFLLLLAALVMLIWVVFKPFVIFIVTGVFIAVLALPIDRFWEKVVRKNRIAAVFTMLTLVVIITLPLVGLGFALANDASALAESIQSGRAQERMEELIDNPAVQAGLEFAYPNQTAEERNATLRANMQEWQKAAQDWLTEFAKDLVGALPRFFIALTVILFVVYYVLTDGDRLTTYLRRAAPLPPRQVDYLLGEANNGLKAVFVGQILTALIQGALGGVGFFIAGVPGAIVWGAVMAILSLIPVVGAFLVWIPAAIFLFLDGQIGWGIFLVVWGIVVVSQVDNFIRPKLIGDRADIHPLFVLIGILGGLAAFGFIGLFLGPLIVGVTISVLKVWEDQYMDPLVSEHAEGTRHAPTEEE